MSTGITIYKYELEKRKDRKLLKTQYILQHSSSDFWHRFKKKENRNYQVRKIVKKTNVETMLAV